MIKQIKLKSIGVITITLIFICALIIILGTGCTFATANDENTAESVSKIESLTEDTTVYETELEFGKIELSELINKDIEDKISVIPVLITKNNDVSDKEVYDKVIKPLGNYGEFDNEESYFRNNVVHLTPAQIKMIECPENMSLSFDKAFPTPGMNIFLDDLKETIKVNELVVVIKFNDDELFNEWKQMNDAGMFADNEESVAAKNKMYNEYAAKIISDYGFTEEDLVYNNKSKPDSWIFAYVNKNTLAEMMLDSRLESFSIFDMSPVTDF